MRESLMGPRPDMPDTAESSEANTAVSVPQGETVRIADGEQLDGIETVLTAMADAEGRAADLEEVEWTQELDHLMADASDSTLFESDAIELPPERVRFTTLATLSPEGNAGHSDAVLTNLSIDGAACICAIELARGARAEIRFRLGVGGDPLTLATEVMWCRAREQGDRLYGLKFLDCDKSQQELLAAAVNERVQGRAGEWPMPVIPGTQNTPEGQRQRSPWVAGAAGMALGIGLSLMITVWPTVDSQPSTVAVAPAVVKSSQAGTLVTATEAISRATGVGLTQFAGQDSANEETRVPLVFRSDSVDEPAAKTVPLAPSAEVAETETTEAVAEEDTGPAVGLTDLSEGVAADTEQQVAQPSVADLVAPSVKEATGAKAIGLSADGPIENYRTFWLSNPDRFVIDIPNRRSGAEALAVAANHPFVERVRVGNHDDKVRFVLETKAATPRRPDIRIDGTKLHVGFAKEL